MFTALAVSRDVALSEGDAISAKTERLLGETAGGPVRYHVYAPDGVLVTGYAVPPVPLSRKLPKDQVYAYYDALYRGEPARVLRLKDEASISGLSGTFTITVWQDLSARNAFVAHLALRSLAIILTLLFAVALLVWFGVRLGLKPLLDLEDAISRRSSEDLSPIRRAVPVETVGIVRRLNNLFAQVSSTIEAQTNFVSDAAHQLRNPIAGLRALAEATVSAPDLKSARQRAQELTDAAVEASALAERLLTLERARAEAGVEKLERVDLNRVVRDVAGAFENRQRADGVVVTMQLEPGAVWVLGDEVMLCEALTNLIDNAFVHGGDGLSRIGVSLARRERECVLTVEDDGCCVPVSAIPKILARFGQGEPGKGSGLGLSIADAVATRHGGQLDVLDRENGFAVRVTFPCAAP